MSKSSARRRTIEAMAKKHASLIVYKGAIHWDFWDVAPTSRSGYNLYQGILQDEIKKIYKFRRHRIIERIRKFFGLPT